MSLDKHTLQYVLEVAMSYEECHVQQPFKALVSRLSTMLEEQKTRLDVGDMARTKAGKFVVITEVHEGGYLAAFADSLRITIPIDESDIDFGGKGIAS